MRKTWIPYHDLDCKAIRMSLYKHNATLELLEATIYRLAFPNEPWSLGRLMHWRKTVCPYSWHFANPGHRATGILQEQREIS